MIDELKKKGIIAQVSLLFLIGTLVIGLLTFLSEREIAAGDVKYQVEDLASSTAKETENALKDFPAESWLIRYWYENYEDMDIDYDEDHISRTNTKDKIAELNARYPDIQIQYASEEEITSMTEDCQKLYAEIAYAMYIMRINEIKRTYGIDYLFGVVTEEPYEEQLFLFSAADPDSVRGTNYEEVYPIGVQVTVSESQQQAMSNAVVHLSHLADAGNYMDYYTCIDQFDDNYLLIGMTYNLDDMNSKWIYKTLSGMVTAIVFQITLSLVCLTLLYFFMLKPLKEVQQNIRLYKQNKDSVSVRENLSKIRPKNELGQLSKDVSELSEEIDNYLLEIENITAEKERIGVELSLASRIQASMLPNTFPAFPEEDSFEIYATMDPAKEVGGDFYDFFLTDDDHLAMIIADVSGKGVPAALFMMASKIILENNAMMGKSPGKILGIAIIPSAPIIMRRCS